VSESQPTSRETVRVLAALSDENRFRIVAHLASADDELSCGAISKALDLSPSLLSHHLSILAEAGIIGRRKNGLWTMNALERPVIERQVAALNQLIGQKAGPNGAAPTGASMDGQGQTVGEHGTNGAGVAADLAVTDRGVTARS
jgi:ArsR family transcriptional regulator, arsenate/arsenite/antimonite-responsive transcriptional repressor